jgi:hypothetical protein
MQAANDAANAIRSALGQSTQSASVDIANVASGKTSSGSGSSGSNTGKTVQVQSNGKAPSGLSVGDSVKTAGGTYKITGVKADGSYNSTKVTEVAKK